MLHAPCPKSELLALLRWYDSDPYENIVSSQYLTFRLRIALDKGYFGPLLSNPHKRDATAATLKTDVTEVKRPCRTAACIPTEKDARDFLKQVALDKDNIPHIEADKIFDRFIQYIKTKGLSFEGKRNKFTILIKPLLPEFGMIYARNIGNGVKAYKFH